MEFYQPQSGITYTDEDLQAKTGFSPLADPSYLASNGIYTVNATVNPYDTGLYETTPTYVIVGDYANQSWTATPLPLATAKDNAHHELKRRANEAVNIGACACGYTNDLLTAVASLAVGTRPARFQAELTAMANVALQLDIDLTAVTAATTVDEINNIVNPPTGTINLYRTGEDLEVATFSAFDSLTLTEAGTELYVPGTTTTISWSGTDFPATVAAFNLGDYVIQLRQVANGLVIKEFEVTTTPTDYDF
mgnify:CR=1 FL=1